MGHISGSAVARSAKKKTAIQKQALAKVVGYFKKNNRALVTMACGSGKSRLIYMTIAAMGQQISIVAVPTLGLVKQIRDRAASWKPLQKHSRLLVCSSIRRGEVNETPEDYGLNVTTNPEVIRAAMLNSSKTLPLLIVVTYQSFDKIQAAVDLGKKINIGLLVCDEAHNTAGDRGKKMAGCLDDSIVKISKRLFLTATPRVIGRGVADPDSMNCMNDPAVYGRLVYELPFGEAIRQGITCDYEIRSMEVRCDAAKVKELNGKGCLRSEGRLDEVARYIEKEMKKNPGMRIFSFHNKCQNAQAFNQALLRCNVWSRCITGEMPVADREEILREFESPGKSRIITSVRVFSEGVDVPSVDTVMLMDPSTTPHQIAQMVGRGQRVEEGKKLLTIFLPIFHPVGQQVDVAEATAKTSEFSIALKVLRTMASLDVRLVSEMRNGGDAGEATGGRKILTFDYSAEFAPVIKSLLLKKVVPFEPKTVEELIEAFRMSIPARPATIRSMQVVCGRTINAWGQFLWKKRWGIAVGDLFDLVWPDTSAFNPESLEELIDRFRDARSVRPESASGLDVICGRSMDAWASYLLKKQIGATLSEVFDIAWPDSKSFVPDSLNAMVDGFRLDSKTRPEGPLASIVICGKKGVTWQWFLTKQKWGVALLDVFDLAWPESKTFNPECPIELAEEIRKKMASRNDAKGKSLVISGRTLGGWSQYAKRKWGIALSVVLDMAWPESVKHDPSSVLELIALFRTAYLSRPKLDEEKEICGRTYRTWGWFLRQRKWGVTLQEVFDLAWPPNGEFMPSSIEDAISHLRKHHKRRPGFGESPCGISADRWEVIAKSLGTTVLSLMQRAWPDA